MLSLVSTFKYFNIGLGLYRLWKLIIRANNTKTHNRLYCTFLMKNDAIRIVNLYVAVISGSVNIFCINSEKGCPFTLVANIGYPPFP